VCVAFDFRLACFLKNKFLVVWLVTLSTKDKKHDAFLISSNNENKNNADNRSKAFGKNSVFKTPITVFPAEEESVS
jgi:hypothetical protein